MIVLTSAIAFTFLILIVILFQVTLAVGVPWGEYAMGGKFPGKYPISMRFACIVQIAILASVVCFCRDSNLVYRRVFSTWDDFESDYEKCMGTQIERGDSIGKSINGEKSMY